LSTAGGSADDWRALLLDFKRRGPSIKSSGLASCDSAVERRGHGNGRFAFGANELFDRHCHIKRFYCPLLPSVVKPDSINSNG
jgi:hypothetical protein